MNCLIVLLARKKIYYHNILGCKKVKMGSSSLVCFCNMAVMRTVLQFVSL